MLLYIEQNELIVLYRTNSICIPSSLIHRYSHRIQLTRMHDESTSINACSLQPVLIYLDQLRPAATRWSIRFDQLQFASVRLRLAPICIGQLWSSPICVDPFQSIPNRVDQLRPTPIFIDHSLHQLQFHFSAQLATKFTLIKPWSVSIRTLLTHDDLDFDREYLLVLALFHLLEHLRFEWSLACGGSSLWLWSPRTPLIWPPSWPSTKWIIRSKASKILPNRRRSSTEPWMVAPRPLSSGWASTFWYLSF